MPKLFTVFCLLLATCNAQQFEKNFFRKTPPADRLETMRQYSLEDQYKIYRYGHDKIEPPALILARPIAERGKTAIPFLVDAGLMRILDDRVVAIKNQNVQYSSRDSLEYIRNSPESH